MHCISLGLTRNKEQNPTIEMPEKTCCEEIITDTHADSSRT